MKVKIGERELPIGDMAVITLNEQSGIKRILGKPLHEIDEFDPRDPDMLRAFLWLAFHRNDPKATVERIEQTLTEIEQLERVGAKIEIDMEEEQAQPGPPSPSESDESSGANAQPETQSSGNGGSPSGSEILPRRFWFPALQHAFPDVTPHSIGQYTFEEINAMYDLLLKSQPRGSGQARTMGHEGR